MKKLFSLLLAMCLLLTATGTALATEGSGGTVYVTGTGNIEKIFMYPSTDAGDENLITTAMAGKIDYAFCKDSSQIQQLQNMEDYTVYTVNVTFPRYIFVNMYER